VQYILQQQEKNRRATNQLSLEIGLQIRAEYDWRVFFRIAVVTGGNKGIGLEICRQLASKGITVVLTARSEKRGMAAVQELKGAGLHNVIFHQLDITDAPGIARLAGFFKDHLGRIDFLVIRTCRCCVFRNLRCFS
jgi:NADP-dependent 3-hydroxy acid dehydrogenase YdfG